MLAGGITQPDLFAEPPAPRWWLGDGDEAQVQRLGWERRALRDLAQSPLVYSSPGFMGSVCERLVAQGLAEREDAGFAPMPEGLSKRQLREMGWKAEDHPQFRYALTEAGRAVLSEAAQ